MTNELKQRLIGAVVITAIAAIFIPMLFDDPVKESGQVVNELIIPTPPSVAQPDNALAKPVTPEGEALDVADGLEAPPIADFDSNAEPVSPPEAAVDSRSGAADKRVTDADPLEDMAALKDKKEREKILHESAEEDVLVTSALDEEANGKASKVPLEVEQREEVKLAAEKEKRAKEKAVVDKKTAEKLAQEQLEYRKLAEKKAQEKQLANKLAQEKLAAEAKLAAKQQALDDKAAVAKIAEDKLAAEKAGANSPAMVRWYVRLGSFGKEVNAMSLRDNLRKQGYPAVVDIIKSAEKGMLYRVRVGPELSKELAEKTRQKMDVENHTQSILELE